jgi:hypothetical protein
MVAGLANSLPGSLSSGLTAQGVPAATANTIAQLPPVGTLFAAFLGFNPISQLLGPAVLGALPQANAAKLTGLEFFPQLISKPFHDGLVIVFWLAIAMALVGAAASLIKDRKPVAGTETASAAVEQTGEFIAHEAELQAELADAVPVAPMTAIPEPLEDKVVPDDPASLTK